MNATLDDLRSACARAAGPLLKLRARLRACNVYLSALLILAASRLVMLIGNSFAAKLAPVPNPPSWDPGPDWYHRLLRWDSGWYASIVEHGYTYSSNPTDQTSVVFYPLYPLATYGLKLLGVHEYVGLLIVANVAMVIAALLMTKLVKDELGEETALLSLTFLCFLRWWRASRRVRARPASC